MTRIGLREATTTVDKPRETMQDALNAYLADRPGRPVAPTAASEPKPTTAPSKPPTGKEALVEAYDKLIEHEATKPRGYRFPMAARWRKFVQPTIIAVSTAAMVYFALAKPKWLYPRVEPISAPTSDVRAQQTLVAASVIAEQYRLAHGRLPTSLADAGVDIPSVSLLPAANGGFRLVGGTVTHPLTLRAAPGSIPILEGVTR